MEALLNILQDLHPEVDFTDNCALIDDGILDSFDIISIIAALNDEFDITVSAEEIVPENFNSAEALYAMTQRLADE
ncbi:hypothetical protein FACS1894217_00640 [Clostridia bacterium]|nr:hypothetical protein FACS1894217_00640 [Clostridia bacterium]